MPQKYKRHSFRDKLASGGQHRISLERQNMNVAYRIVKLQTIDAEPGEDTPEITVKIYREEQSAVNNDVDFSDVDLLGVAYYRSTSNVSGDSHNIIFDNTIFSRDIYVTAVDTHDDQAANYYIELEEVPVTSATLMQLKLGVARKLNLQQD